MKISGFSMCRNADKLYYPFMESIASALPIVDEFAVAVGRGDHDDQTLAKLRAWAVSEPKLRVIETEWDLAAFTHGTVHAQQTDLAKAHCSGDWLLYLQADEVLHEADLEQITSACREALSDPRIDGFLLEYLHFWGDYAHLQRSHVFYDREIRIVRNDPSIHSWQSAQSFRRIRSFDGRDYRQAAGSEKLQVRRLKARVFHYGWVRPPEVMTSKMNELDRIHSHRSARFSGPLDFGDVEAMPRFEGTHPAVMREVVARFNWKDRLRNASFQSARPMRHRRLKSRILTWVELHVLGGKRFFAFRNYRIIR